MGREWPMRIEPRPGVSGGAAAPALSRGLASPPRRGLVFSRFHGGGERGGAGVGIDEMGPEEFGLLMGEEGEDIGEGGMSKPLLADDWVSIFSDMQLPIAIRGPRMCRMRTHSKTPSMSLDPTVKIFVGYVRFARLTGCGALPGKRRSYQYRCQHDSSTTWMTVEISRQPTLFVLLLRTERTFLRGECVVVDVDLLAGRCWRKFDLVDHVHADTSRQTPLRSHGIRACC